MLLAQTRIVVRLFISRAGPKRRPDKPPSTSCTLYSLSERLRFEVLSGFPMLTARYYDRVSFGNATAAKGIDVDFDRLAAMVSRLWMMSFTQIKAVIESRAACLIWLRHALPGMAGRPT